MKRIFTLDTIVRIAIALIILGVLYTAYLRATNGRFF